MKKRILSIVMAIAVAATTVTAGHSMNTKAEEASSYETNEEYTERVNSWDGTADTTWYQDDMTEYHISTPQQLAGLAELVNQGNTFEGKTITLCEDIYLNEEDAIQKYEWTSIASCPTRDDTELRFEGTFDGNAHSIYHMYVSENGSGGLFGRIGKKGIVKSVTIADGICDYGGCIANVNEGEILFCRNKSEVWKKNEFAVGGICNYNYNILYGCQNYGEVWGSQVGGIVGSNMAHGSSVENCSNHGVVFSTSEAAGIAAYNYSWIYNCYNVGTVASEGRSISGIVYQNDHVVTNCYVASDYMYGSDTRLLDAICISNHSTISNCYYIPVDDVTSSDGTEITQEDIVKPSFLERLNIKQYDWQTGDWIVDEYGINEGMPIHPADYNLSAGTVKKMPELWFDSMNIKTNLEDGFYELNVRGFYNLVMPVITVSDNSLAEVVYEGTVESGKVIIEPKKVGEGQIIIMIPDSTGNYSKQYTIDLQIQHECSSYTEVINKQPTCTQKGEKLITCDDCGNTRTEEIDMISHSYIEESVIYPTYDTEGYTNYSCIYCGNTYIGNIKPKLTGTGIQMTDNVTGESYIHYKAGDYNFISRDGKTAELWGYYGKEKNFVIPQTVYADGKAFTVTSIGEYAFYNQTYESIVLPDTVTKMEDWTNYTKVTGYIYLPRSLNTIDAYEDILGNAQYMCWKDSYAHRYLLDMEEAREFDLSLDFSIFCVDAPPKVTGLCQTRLGTDSVTLSWQEVQNGSGYVIISCDKNGKYRKTVGTIADAKTLSYSISGLKSDTNYYYKIRSVHNYKGRTYYSDDSEMLLIRTKLSQKETTKQNQKIKKGYTAKITHKKIKLPASVLTTYDSGDLSYEIYEETGLLIECSHGEWATVNELSHFWDYKGLYNLACANSKNVFITRYDNRLKKKKTVKIKKKYPLIGDVIGDDAGNYYIVWGKEDVRATGKIATIAVSKYTYAGKHVKTYQMSRGEYGDDWATCIPFDAGNCSTIIVDGVLVCLYAREMYNGHQSSTVIAVNTDDMSENEYYSTYTSHSFNQHVIALRGGGVCYADHGDGYPRGFAISFSNTENYEEQVPFHFYGDRGENYTNAMLGGICETSGGIFLVGASAKSMTKKAEKQGKNLFIQLVDQERKITGSVSRKGKACGESYKDTGIKWLTNYSNKYDVENPQIVKTDDDRIVVLWEKFKGSKFIQSYYMIFAADGSTLQEATSMKGTRLSSFENPLYKNGKVYWTTAGEIVRTRETLINSNISN